MDPSAAEEFLEQFHAENPHAGPAAPRIAEVLREIDATGTYRHTADELTFGARIAWRNNARCIGRLYWQSLQVRDLRTVTGSVGIAELCFDHLRSAYNRGKIRPMISVFAPDTPSRPGPKIWNEQLIRYAGYAQPDGSVLGDPRYVAFTSTLMERGWRPPEHRGAFDVLPAGRGDRRGRAATVPASARGGGRGADRAPRADVVRRPRPALARRTGISNNRMDIGGVCYPAAPFNGWYMGTEIGARNFGDIDRYDLVPTVAERMGLDTSDDATLWRDRALVEINRAVLHSFHAHGVTITDHHTESRRFLTHVEKEERAGRRCPADWTWIVPPMSGSQTPVFHRYYENADLRPNDRPPSAHDGHHERGGVGPRERRSLARTSRSRLELSVGVALEVGHAVMAIEAQGRIAVVGQQHDQSVRAVPGRRDQPEGGAASPGIVQEALLGAGVGDQGGDSLGHDGAFLPQPGHVRQDLLGLVQPDLLLRHLAPDEAALRALGLLRVPEQHHEIAGGREVPGTHGPFSRLLQRPVVWLGHCDPPSPTGAQSARGTFITGRRSQPPPCQVRRQRFHDPAEFQRIARR